MNEEIQFGDKVKDTVTGFSGIVTAKAFYATGCNQLLVQPKLSKKNTWSSPHWFDIERVELVEKGKVDIKASPSGGPRGAEAAPLR